MQKLAKNVRIDITVRLNNFIHFSSIIFNLIISFKNLIISIRAATL